MNTLVIGINGFKRTGKGETASALERFAPFPVQTLGFADKLKVYAALCLGFSRGRSDAELIALMDEAKTDWHIDVSLESGDYLESPFHDLTGRQYLQEMGTRARELFGEDFWVDQVLPNPNAVMQEHGLGESQRLSVADAQLRTRYPGVTLVAFSDLRFENEAKRVLDLGGEVWEITRPGTESDGHDSEQTLPRDLVTTTIVNDGTLADLESKVAVELANYCAGYRPQVAA